MERCDQKGQEIGLEKKNYESSVIAEQFFFQIFYFFMLFHPVHFLPRGSMNYAPTGVEEISQVMLFHRFRLRRLQLCLQPHCLHWGFVLVSTIDYYCLFKFLFSSAGSSAGNSITAGGNIDNRGTKSWAKDIKFDMQRNIAVTLLYCR